MGDLFPLLFELILLYLLSLGAIMMTVFAWKIIKKMLEEE